MRRVSLDRGAQELRCGQRSLRDAVSPRSASAAKRVTDKVRATSIGPISNRAGGRSARPRIQTRGCRFASTSATASLGCPIREPASRSGGSVRPPPCARRSRPAGSVTRGAARFSEDWVPGRWLSDTHVVSPLARGLYHADGQMQDEVYNYGSFKQSRMFAAGVTCSDCHDPHSAKLVASGDSVCTQCHAADTYASARHTPSRAGEGPDRMRVLPYAGAHLHGGRPAPRPQFPRSAPGSVGKTRHAECLQRLPRGQDRRMGGGRDRGLVRSGPEGIPELCRGFPRGLERWQGCGGAACCGRARRVRRRSRARAR